jgi:hypothetical protein
MQRLLKKELPAPVLKLVLRKVLDKKRRKMSLMRILRMSVKNNRVLIFNKKGEGKPSLFLFEHPFVNPPLSPLTLRGDEGGLGGQERIHVEIF